MTTFCPSGGSVRVTASSTIAIPGLSSENNVVRLHPTGGLRVIFGDSTVSATTNGGLNIAPNVSEHFLVPSGVTHVHITGFVSSAAVTVTTGYMSA